MKKRLAGITLAAVLSAPVASFGEQPFHYDRNSVEPATYYAALSNLANAVMFSGMGEQLIFSPYERDDWLRRAGYVTRPPMPDMGIVGTLFAAAEPRFQQTPDFADPETLRWQPDSFDRTLDPGAQAWTLLKISSPQFHLQFHDLPENRIAALMMLPQARSQARVLDRRLRNDSGLFIARTADGAYIPPTPRDQAAVLWAVSSLILAATSTRNDYWHMAFAEMTDPDDTRPLADRAFAAVSKLPPTTPADRAIAIEALGRYALATNDPAQRRQALDSARRHADTLLADSGKGLEDIALGVYGLVEAGRLLNQPGYSSAAAERFRNALLPRWNAQAGSFLPTNDNGRLTPTGIGALIAAVNAMRWYGPADLAAQAQALYPKLFEGAIIRSGLLLGSPLALVSKQYRDAQPAANFAHPLLADPAKSGTAAVFATEVRFDNGNWSVSDGRFVASPAMFLTNMLALRSNGRADPFLDSELLQQIR